MHLHYRDRGQLRRHRRLFSVALVYGPTQGGRVTAKTITSRP